MITDVRYKFADYLVAENGHSLSLSTKSGDCNPEQKILFTAMLNFGYIGFEQGVFSLTARDIVGFWNYAKSAILQDYTVDCYYALLNLGKPYRERIPSLKTDGAFHANDFKMTIVWAKNDAKIFSAPIAYKQEGLKLKELEFGDTIGILYPEYLDLYYKVDNANTQWKDWGNKEKYEFLEDLETHSIKREIMIPPNLKELLNKHKDEV